MADWEMEVYKRMAGRVAEAETKHLSTKKFVPYLLHLMNHERTMKEGMAYNWISFQKTAFGERYRI